MQNNQLTKTGDPWAEIAKLRKRMDVAKNPAPKDVERLRHLASTTPNYLNFDRSVTQTIRRQLIEKISHSVSRAYMLAEVDMLAKQLDYDAAPHLERLLIDHILTVRLRLVHAENIYNSVVVNQSMPLKSAEYWDNLLSSTQARFLRAIEALARVRKLARNTTGTVLEMVECSLPKLLFGHNGRLLETQNQLDAALTELYRVLSKTAHVLPVQHWKPGHRLLRLL